MVEVIRHCQWDIRTCWSICLALIAEAIIPPYLDFVLRIRVVLNEAFSLPAQFEFSVAIRIFLAFRVCWHQAFAAGATVVAVGLCANICADTTITPVVAVFHAVEVIDVMLTYAIRKWPAEAILISLAFNQLRASNDVLEVREIVTVIVEPVVAELYESIVGIERSTIKSVFCAILILVSTWVELGLGVNDVSPIDHSVSLISRTSIATRIDRVRKIAGRRVVDHDDGGVYHRIAFVPVNVYLRSAGRKYETQETQHHVLHDVSFFYFLFFMTQPQELLAQAREHVGNMQSSLTEAHKGLLLEHQTLEAQLPKAQEADKITLATLLAYNKKRQHEVDSLIPSPYFARCDVQSEHKTASLFVGKFSFTEQNIVSWISPISTLRFSHPGEVNYTLPDRTKKHVTLNRKDEYMINHGKIVFFATENTDTPRTLVYQEHFSNRKTGFVLPEIVSRMEEAQDRIIRSSYKGPLVISGPAGSGKTTLALHRVAYLMQAPEIKDFFPAFRIRVFVQDEGTKSYFASLLPDLGIDNVEITTFQRWASDILSLPQRQGEIKWESERVEENIICQKLDILKMTTLPLQGTAVEFLKDIYDKNFISHKEIVLERISRNIFDDIDLTILLLAYKKTQGRLQESREYLVQQKNSYEVKRKMGRFDVSYNLCVIDEFQNYLPEQLQLIGGCMNEEMRSVVYVGDMRQQTRFGTVQSWDEVGEQIDPSRIITLEKVYRNTKEILRSIQSLGYNIEIPDALPEGTPVITLPDTRETQEQIFAQCLKNTDRLIGILAKENAELEEYAPLKEHKHIKVLTIREAQGVEFDTVFLVGNKPDTWLNNEGDLGETRNAEKKRINKDLLYVALTRAMREMYVVGIL